MIGKRFLRLGSFLLLIAMLIAFLPSAAHAVPTNTSFAAAKLLSSDIGDQITVTGIKTGTSVYYYLNASSGQQIYTTIYSMSSGANYDLRLYNASKTLLASSTRVSSAIDFISHKATYTGKYYIRVEAKSVTSK